jgi:hypothetical protein
MRLFYSVPLNKYKIWTEYDTLCYVIVFLAYFPYFEKIKLGLCDHHAVCVSVYPPINF